MAKANWTTQLYGVIQSLLFNNPHRVVGYLVPDGKGGWRNRADTTAPVRRLFETEAPSERTCLRTIQFVHHMLIPPGGRHVAELHIHPDAEEIVVITRGSGRFRIGNQNFDAAAQDVFHIPPSTEHELRNIGSELLGALFINVPTGPALARLAEAQLKEPGSDAPQKGE